MRLSEFSTEQAMDVLCEITPRVEAILADEELTAEITALIKPEEGMTWAQVALNFMQKLSRIVPILLRKRREDVYGILSAVNDKSAEEIAQQNVLVTMCQIREIIRDRELLDFFKSCADSQGSE